MGRRARVRVTRIPQAATAARLALNSPSVAVGSVLGLLHAVEHGQAEMLGAALARRHAPDHVGPVRDGVLRVERALLPREALADDLGVAVHPDVGGGAHGAGAQAGRERACEAVSMLGRNSTTTKPKPVIVRLCGGAGGAPARRVRLCTARASENRTFREMKTRRSGWGAVPLCRRTGCRDVHAVLIL